MPNGLKSGQIQASVLIATDDSTYAQALSSQMEVDGFDAERCHDAQGVLRRVGVADYEIIILDLHLSNHDLDLVSYVRHKSPGTRLILLFGSEEIDRAVEGIRRGAYFYLPRSASPADVSLAARKAAQHLASERSVQHFEQQAFEEMLGSTPAMRRVIEVITKVAPTDSTVLLLGESGVGKDLLANTVHRLSRRREQPFIAVNCAALPEQLLESELFGHKKGSFTGADSDKRGLFEEADGGTIFLDEIGDMALITQAKLLRVLQNGEIRRVGDSQSRHVNVRIIAATNKNLEEEVAERNFREDLYFRLNVVQVYIPPLRERREVVPKLVQYFTSRAISDYGKNVNGYDDEATMLLSNYSFPGNVRELESIIQHAVIMCDDEIVRAKDLPDAVREGGPRRLALGHEPGPNGGVAPLSEIEREHIRLALEKLDGNQTEAAKQLGISRSTLWRKIKEYNLS